MPRKACTPSRLVPRTVPPEVWTVGVVVVTPRTLAPGGRPVPPEGGSGRHGRPAAQVLGSPGCVGGQAAIDRNLARPGLDGRTPSRTRFRRGGLVVLAAADGMVLRVDRRSR